MRVPENAMNKFTRILSAAVFVSATDVFGDTFATASREFVLTREETSVPTVNFSIFKGILLSRERVASLMMIATSLSGENFREKFLAKIATLTEEQAQAVLVVCQVRPMAVPVETEVKFSYGSPVFTSFVQINRSAFLAGSETELSTLGRAQQTLGLQPADEVGLQLMLAPRIVVANRTISKGQSTYSGMDFDDDDDDGKTKNPNLVRRKLTSDELDALSVSQIKAYVGAKFTAKADGSPNKATMDYLSTLELDLPKLS